MALGKWFTFIGHQVHDGDRPHQDQPSNCKVTVHQYSSCNHAGGESAGDAEITETNALNEFYKTAFGRICCAVKSVGPVN